MNTILLVDKVSGPTSFDAVRFVRRYFGKLAVGHAGTLDPFATGLLVVMTGKATKLSDFLTGGEKHYLAEIELGKTTDTLDRTGQVIREEAIPPLTDAGIDAALKSFVGTWMQTPPMFSAKKVQGVRLYQLARKQIEVPRSPVPVEIRVLERLEYSGNILKVRVECSKGTYVRSLAEAIGERLGTVAHLRELRRTGSGAFSLEDGAPLSEIEKDWEGYLASGRGRYETFCSQQFATQKLGKTARPMIEARDI